MKKRAGKQQPFRLLTVWQLCFGLCLAGLFLPAAEAGEQAWLERLMPLPQEIRVEDGVWVDASQVDLRLPEPITARDSALAELLAPLAPGGDLPIRFHLVKETSIKVQQAWSQAMEGVAFPDQAYCIESNLTEGRVNGLQITALTREGLWYGAQTLRRLLQLEDVKDNRLHIPCVWIRDWPDIEWRGQWGWSFIDDLDWMSAHKFNIIEMHSNLGFAADGTPTASFDKSFQAACNRRNIRVVPVVRHLEQLAKTGLFRHHPDVASTPEPGKPLPNDYQPGVCFSRPKTVDLLAGWIEQLLDQPGIDEVNVWLAETEAGCYCDLCRDQDPFVLEAKSVCKAFEMARRGRKNVSLNILLSQASYPHNAAILQAIDPGTHVTFYHGQLTYDSSSRPMIDSLLTGFSHSGGWLGVYPQLTASWRTVFPFSAPQLIRARMQEFVQKGLRSFRGYATPRNEYYRPTVAAAAEWGWNSDGRSIADFSRAFGRQQGLTDVQAYSDWVEIIGPVAWKLAGSRTVEGLIFAAGGQVFVDGIILQGAVAEKLQNLEYGGWLLSEFHSAEEVAQALADAEKAAALAALKGTPAMQNESEAVVALLNLLRDLKTLSEIGSAGLADSEIDRLLRAIDLSAFRIAKAVSRWGQIVHPVSRSEMHERFRDSVDFSAHMAEVVRADVLTRQLPDEWAAYRSQPLGSWDNRLFAAQADTVLILEIDPLKLSPGSFDVICRYDSGMSGVDFQAAELLRGARLVDSVPVDRDQFSFRLNRYNRVKNFWLELPAEAITDSEQLWLRIHLTGPALDLPADRRTTFGRF
ncbi:hypothetical protein JW992_16035, partial [candidate division KSB1 bacterium]|nr:hypothetical protein [candidate division KSB1 bacterium]